MNKPTQNRDWLLKMAAAEEDAGSVNVGSPDGVMEDRDRFVAGEIRAGRCPFGKLQPGQGIGHCPLGFPGCGCGDELLENKFLQEESGNPTDAFEPPTVNGEVI